MLQLFRNVASLIREGVLQSEVGQTFAMDQIADAVRVADQPGRAGKILLRLGS